MKINLAHLFTNLDGSALVLAVGPGKTEPATLANVLVNIVIGEHPRVDAEVSGTEKVRRLNLARALYKGGEFNLSLTDATFFIQRAPAFYGPLIAGQLIELLESVGE